ncbi:B-cell CLL/lymphoma 9-like protein [Hippocampus zosterae]|uniref:B-cell CLL/lymphoma 9-like protein n=1 Tax=Hippocampus zosterae TaxID=109293 RepID=UPI00223D41BF|nr:B-cell CLL/lymphoma 9-like protein [Hippocampus zosterae]
MASKVTGDGRSQMAAVNLQAQQQQQQQQGAAGHLAPKSRLSSGAHGINKSNPGPKATTGQSASSVGGMLKTKSKRERSASVDSGEPRHTALKTLEADAKAEGVMRSKRRCVLEKKQPYSGDEWCSGPDTEDDEDKPHSTTQRERVLPGPRQGQPDHPPAGATGSGPAMACGPGPGPGHGPGLKRGPLAPQSSKQLLYVFTTSMANSAAEAVMKGKMDSILQFHQQNVPRTKLEQGPPLASNTEKVNSSASPTAGTPVSKSGTPRPNSAGGGVSSLAAETPTSGDHTDNASPRTRHGGLSISNSILSHRPEGDGRGTPLDPVSGTAHDEGLPIASLSPSGSPSILSAHLQSVTGHRSGPGSAGGLSKEQLEHRERSLQTLRDIERLFLRTGARGSPHGDTGGSNSNLTNNASNVMNNNRSDQGAILEDGDNGTNTGDCSSGSMALSALASLKKFEEPLQSIMSQTQSLSTATHSPEMDPHHNLLQHPHHQLSSPGLDMGPLLGPEGLTQEQIAWRKLQEEYYQEKRRQQEMQNPQHFRMMTEMGFHGGPVMMRGPPPPYHSKPGDHQWASGNMMGGGLPGNVRMAGMHQEGPGRPKFLAHMQRGPPGGAGFPGSPGGMLSVDALGPQRATRPGIWLDNMASNMDGGGPIHGCYPPQHLQDDPELLTREELFRLAEKRQMQGLPRFELDRIIAQQQQGNMGSRIMGNPGGPDISNLGMGRGPPSNQGDPMDFPGSRDMMGSPGGGPQIRDLIDTPLGSNLSINMNPQMNIQQQHMTLSQKLRRGPGSAGPLSEFFSPAEIARIRASQNERRNMGMVSGPDGPFRFPTPSPFSGGPGEGPYPQQPGPEMFGSEQEARNSMGGTSRLSHMPIAGELRGLGPGPRHPTDLSVNVHPLTTPAVQRRHQLNSPSLLREPPAHLPSPSAPGQKSPSIIAPAGPHPPLPPTSGAGTPCSSSMKSPQIMGSSNPELHSPSISPGRLKSPAMAIGSPAWMSPKTDPSSPGGLTGLRAAGNGGGHSETGRSIHPRSSNSTPSSQAGSMNPSMTFATSPDTPKTQNPLSLIMSQMSKYALPSSTPLYHDAIKTIATSDDEMLPDRPLLPGVSMGGNMGNPPPSQMLVSQSSIGAQSDSQSPVGIPSQGQQQLSHDGSEPVLSSPNPLGLPVMSSTMMVGGSDDLGPCNVSPISQNQMAAFPRLQPPSHVRIRSPISRMSQNFPQSGEDILPPQQLHLIAKDSHQRHPHPSESFPPLPMGDGPDLSEVIRPTHSGIPEFDLSRIIPSDKPRSTLQYFPKSEPHQNPNQGTGSQPPPSQQLLKHLSSSGPPHISSSNPHLANLQNMMAEQQLTPHQGQGGLSQNMAVLQGDARGMVSGAGIGPMCPPGHILGGAGMVSQQQQQAMMANSFLHHPSGAYPGMMSPQQHQHNLMARQNAMMMQAKQRNMPIPGDPFGPQSALMSPQGALMAPSHAQTGMMGPQSFRQRGMSLDSPIGYGPGGMANMPF